MDFYLSMGRELDHSFTEINKMPATGSGIWMTATGIGIWFLSNAFMYLLLRGYLLYSFVFELIFIVIELDQEGYQKTVQITV
jgi:hypothetical protein